MRNGWPIPGDNVDSSSLRRPQRWDMRVIRDFMVFIGPISSLFVIRTMGNPFRSRPSRSLMVTTIAIVGIGIALPMTPLAALLGFTRLPWSYFAFLIAATVVYLVMVDVAKRQLARRLAITTLEGHVSTRS